MLDVRLSEAVIAFVGEPGRVDSRSPEERVVERLGDQGIDVLGDVKQIVCGVYDADPPLHHFATLSEIGEAVCDFLHREYPQLSEDAVNAVANRFTYDWR